MRRAVLLLVAFAVPAVALAGCAAPTAGSADVIVTFYPLRFLVSSIAPSLAVDTLVPAGTEPHDWEPTPADVVRLGSAKLVVALGAGFEPWLTRTLEGIGSGRPPVAYASSNVALINGEEGADPHVWLDPSAMATMAKNVAPALSAAFPHKQAEVDAGVAALVAQLEGLDTEYAEGLHQCETRVIIVAHDAYAYLAARYNITQVALSGLSPEAEPTVEARREAIEAAREHNVSVIFFEDAVSERVAKVIADEVKATTAVLYPIETLTDAQRDAGESYVTLMRANLASLRGAMRCA